MVTVNLQSLITNKQNQFYKVLRKELLMNIGKNSELFFKSKELTVFSSKNANIWTLNNLNFLRHLLHNFYK